MFIFWIPGVFGLQAQNSWPAETWTNATNLTSLYPGFTNNLSGAHWNPLNRELWLVINGPGTIVKVVENGTGGFQHEAAWNPGGDLEGITQADLSDTTVFVIEENTGTIKEYNVALPGVATLIHSWNISSEIPAYDGFFGPEGIAFVPDEWLIINGFKEHSGANYVSQHGMGGLIFVAHQNGGNIYVFDLDRLTNSYSFVGEYATNRIESAALEFDRSTGYLHIWHNIASNFLEVTDLTSVPNAGIRKLTVVEEYFGPITGNLEGIAFTPAITNEDWCWITLDDGITDALRWFDQFSPCLVYADFTVNEHETCVGTPVLFENSSVGTCGTEVYHWNFGQGASPDTIAGAGPHLVSYSTVGAKDISLTIEGSITDVTTKTGILNVHPEYTRADTVSVCRAGSHTFPDGTMLANIMAQVIDTSLLLTSDYFCDSIVITTVEVIPIDTSVTVNGPVLSSNEINASYQWIDCSTMMPVTGENNWEFTAAVNGSYAVIVTAYGCADTSGCYDVTATSLTNNNLKKAITVFPIPTSGDLNIDLAQQHNSITIDVINLLGWIVSTHNFTSTDKVVFNLGAGSGIYFVRVSTNEGQTATLKVLKNQ